MHLLFSPNLLSTYPIEVQRKKPSNFLRLYSSLHCNTEDEKISDSRNLDKSSLCCCWVFNFYVETFFEYQLWVFWTHPRLNLLIKQFTPCVSPSNRYWFKLALQKLEMSHLFNVWTLYTLRSIALNGNFLLCSVCYVLTFWSFFAKTTNNARWTYAFSFIFFLQSCSQNLSAGFL